MRIPFTLLASLLLALLASTAQAQTPVPSPTPPTVKLAFDHDGLNTEGYKLQVDDGARAIIAVSPLAGAPGSLETSFPALVPGSHTLTIFAYNADVDVQGSPVLFVRIFVAPSPPTNFRLLVASVRPAALQPDPL